jgi:hypothetical protein
MSTPHLPATAHSRRVRYGALSALLAAGAFGSIAIAQADAAPSSQAPASQTNKSTAPFQAKPPAKAAANDPDCANPDAAHAPYVTGSLFSDGSKQPDTVTPTRGGQPLKDGAGNVAAGWLVCP